MTVILFFLSDIIDFLMLIIPVFLSFLIGSIVYFLGNAVQGICSLHGFNLSRFKGFLYLIDVLV